MSLAATAAVAGVFLLTAVGCTQQQAMEMNLALGVNGMRADNGLAASHDGPEPLAVARYRAEDMAAKNYFGHAPPDGCDYRCLFNKNGVSMAWSGEVIAWNTYPIEGDGGDRPYACGEIVPGISASLPIAASREWGPERQWPGTGGSITWRYSRGWRRAADLLRLTP